MRIDSTPGDVVAVFIDEKLSFFARVESILPDVKKGWYIFSFLVLATSPRLVTWILESSQIDGEEFSMGGTPIRIERLPEPGSAPEDLFVVDPELPDGLPEELSKGPAEEVTPPAPSKAQIIAFPPIKGDK